MIDLTDPQMVKLLSEEYFFLQKTIEDFNTQVIQFKAWSVSIGVAALLGAYTKPIAPSGRIGVMIAGLSAVPFWLTETFWKVFQKAHEGRLQAIEECIANECNDYKPLQVWTAWDRSFHDSPIGTWFSVAFDPHVIFPHVFLLFIALLLAKWWPPHTE